MSPKDLLGSRGESIAKVRLLDFCGNLLPYFDVHFLGEKFPTYDLLVELIGVTGSKPYFFAQVKSTRTAGKSAKAKLKTQLKAEDVQAMLECPIPTYLIGVDERNEIAYIVSIHGSIEGGVASIPRTYPLDPGNLKILHDEVRTYWKTLASGSKSKTSAFAL